MYDLNDQEELKKYTRRDFGVWAASAGLLTALPAVANTAAATEREKIMILEKKTIVFVHGALGSAHDFDAVKPGIEAAGHRMVTLDLPAHGADNTPCKDVSLQSYIDKVRSVVRQSAASAANGKVILVGHSFGGISVTQVADLEAERIEKVVYICAFVPKSGESMMTLAQQDKASKLSLALDYDVPNNEARLKPGIDSLKILLSDADDALVRQFAAQPTKPEPISPMSDVVTIEGHGNALARYYIHTARDEVLTLNLQKMMTARLKFAREFTVDTGHLPFVTQAPRIAEILVEIAAG